ncbi:MAG: PA2817 family protein [Halieaceae bacterium]|jgi:hypothetical protein|nr:PA2817 family protein [Halieaceae bacterium]
MNDSEYRAFCLELAASFAARLSQEAEKTSPEDPLRSLASGFEALARGEALYEEGPALVNTLFTHAPEFAPLFPRDLLWFIGGDCLHFMPDEELAKYQQLEDMRIAAQDEDTPFDYRAERAKLLNLQ